MRRIIIFTVVFTAVLAGGVLLTSFTSEKASIPEDVKKILTNSCASCHSDKGSSIARSRLNINQWETYDSAKQAKKRADICKTVTKGSMPPKSYLRKNPQATLTATQKEQICNWK